MADSFVGREVEAIETPALLIDLRKLEANLGAMASFFADRPCGLRPHVKTHKTPILAQRQLAAGAIGITCQKLAEAEVMAEAGITDILVSNQVVEQSKIERLASLASSIDVKVAVDSLENVRALSKAAEAVKSKLGVLVEVDIGMHRCGVPPGEPALRLAREIDRLPGLQFAGLQAYEGHTVFIQDRDERKRRAEQALALAVQTRRLIERDGIECRSLSSGGTGTFDIAGLFPGITEVEAGSYATMDASYGRVAGVGDRFEQELTLLATVISRPSESRAILDAGMKAISPDKGLPLLDIEDVRVDRLTEEHGILVADGARSIPLKIGEKVELVPGHGCTTFNLHDRVYCTRDQIVEAVWPIQARGCFR